MLVRVLNRNQKFEVRDKFAGQEYRFPPGDTVTVPEEVAEHIFGYGLDEKGRWKKFLRMGIANRPDGEKLWANIVVKPMQGTNNGVSGIPAAGSASPA